MDMKTRTFIKKALLALLVASPFTACEDAKNAIIDNLVYINEAATDKSKSLTLVDETTSTTLSVRMAQAAQTDVKVKLVLAPEKLEAYNKKNDAAYKCIDAQYVTFDSEATIKAGQVISDPINVTVTRFDTQGADYAVPLAIQSATGAELAESSSSFIVLIVKPITQYAPMFWYGMGMKVNGDWGIDLNNCTFEWWSRVTGYYGEDQGYSVNNQAIVWAGDPSTNSFYPRFGDVVYTNENGKYVYNFLQVKAMGSQFDTGDPSKGEGLESGKWYHFAYTYDASTGTSLLYKNGTQVAAMTTEKGKKLRIDCFELLCSDWDYWWDNIEMCQVRLWKSTRSAGQIKKGMYSEVEYAHPDLIFYLPMNEGPQEDGTNPVLKDVSGNGHDAVIGSLGKGDPSIAPWEIYTFAQ